MDIHKPKAAHSWRDFAIEIGTIIVGILIALALEQAVEVGHIQREVSEARAALHREMAQDLHVATLWRRERPCWIGGADATAAWADGKGARPHFAAGLMMSYQTAVWDMTRAGAVTHMPLEERLALANFYEDVATDMSVVINHRAAASDIGGYLVRDRLNPGEAADLTRLTGRLRWLSDVEFENAGRILQEGARMGLAPVGEDAVFDARLADFCRPFARLNG